MEACKVVEWKFQENPIKINYLKFFIRLHLPQGSLIIISSPSISQGCDRPILLIAMTLNLYLCLFARLSILFCKKRNCFNSNIRGFQENLFYNLHIFKISFIVKRQNTLFVNVIVCKKFCCRKCFVLGNVLKEKKKKSVYKYVLSETKLYFTECELLRGKHDFIPCLQVYIWYTCLSPGPGSDT